MGEKSSAATKVDGTDKVRWSVLRHDLAGTFGVELFTILEFSEFGQRWTRIYSSHPADYPLGESKDLTSNTSPWLRAVRNAGKPFAALSMAELLGAYGDASLIASLGYDAIVNLPVIDHAGITRYAINLGASSSAMSRTDIAAAQRQVEEFVRAERIFG